MYNRRYTPDIIESLKDNEIFVFGSNLAGIHDGGAARVVMIKFGAVYGQGIGLHGQSYAIPTMQGGPETIKPYADEFIEFAKQHPELTFYVTRIGCGIAGFKDIDIAPLFAAAINVENILLPETFVRAIKERDQKSEEELDEIFGNVIENVQNDIEAKVQALGYTLEEPKAFANSLYWLQPYPIYNAPAFQHLCFRLGDSLYSILVYIKGLYLVEDSDRGSLMPGATMENQIRECEQYDITPLSAVVDANDTSKINYVDSRTGEEFEFPEPGEFQFKEMSAWEINVLGLSYIMKLIEKQGYRVSAYTNVLSIYPSIVYRNQNQECYLYLVAHPVGIPVEPISRVSDDNPFVSWYFADVEMYTIRGSKGNCDDKYFAIGADVYARTNGIIPIEEAYKKYGVVDKKIYKLGQQQ
jgi:hypothetical protein